MAVVELRRRDESEPEEMLDLFSIDDVMYQVPARPQVNIALQYLNNLRRMGPVVADMVLLEQLVGEKAYKALSEYKDLMPGDLAKITDTVVSLTLGAMEEDGKKSGNDGSGPSKSDG